MKLPIDRGIKAEVPSEMCPGCKCLTTRSPGDVGGKSPDLQHFCGVSTPMTAHFKLSTRVNLMQNSLNLNNQLLGFKTSMLQHTPNTILDLQ